MILGMLQARMSSMRLPGKVLFDLVGEPMIIHQIERLRRANKINQVIVITSDNYADNAIAEVCEKYEVEYFRGSLNNVLDRFYQAALKYKPEHILRSTADCPLLDHRLIDSIIEFYFDNDFDYASNTINPTFPDGLDSEIFNYSSLEIAWNEAVTVSDREHVTPFIYQRPTRFGIGSYESSIDLSSLRWTVDETEDFELIKRIYAELYPRNPDFSTDDVLDLLKRHPAWKKLNTMHKRNQKSS